MLIVAVGFGLLFAVPAFAADMPMVLMAPDGHIITTKEAATIQKASDECHARISGSIPSLTTAAKNGDVKARAAITAVCTYYILRFFGLDVGDLTVDPPEE
ncbi:hypothetical protein A2118_03530 [Candidatus Kaiserbacteria bacterium GWA2_50_9]|uniref:Uncharacterized protein n=1 Tax=Candidatus Kaiserbacteria bacterium GWA2_50_9 TaxID=1798474 RepID=A0A1F6BWM0_9BACT|nr:MAG: hypothetical protein A2118_03530 [Candidatus Kaiserbacteria bacterium GWA2_50_9]